MTPHCFFFLQPTTGTAPARLQNRRRINDLAAGVAATRGRLVGVCPPSRVCGGVNCTLRSKSLLSRSLRSQADSNNGRHQGGRGGLRRDG